jgi:hypothetical protein
MTRCPFSLSRLVKVTQAGQVIYKAEQDACRAFPDPHRDESEYERQLAKIDNTTAWSWAKQRIGQNLLRCRLLEEYDTTCAMCDVDDANLLRISHIVPWSADAANRLNPRNAILLCGLHDLAFESGLLTVEDDMSITLNSMSSKTRQVLRGLTRDSLRTPRSQTVRIDLRLVRRARELRGS